jgi:hypothetical protein
MIEVSSRPSPAVFVLTCSGMLSGADFEAIEPQLHQVYKAAPARLLLDWERLIGWDTDGRWSAMWFRSAMRYAVKRIAILGPEIWRDEAARIAETMDRTEVRLFKPRERAAALAWLTYDEAAAVAG